MSDIPDQFYEIITKEPEFIKSFIEEIYTTRTVEKDIIDNEEMMGGP